MLCNVLVRRLPTSVASAAGRIGALLNRQALPDTVCRNWVGRLSRLRHNHTSLIQDVKSLHVADTHLVFRKDDGSSTVSTFWHMRLAASCPCARNAR
jgi:hypothetical protein